MEAGKSNQMERERCGETCTRPTYMNRHIKRCGEKPEVECPYCLEKFSRKDTRDRHVKRKHPYLPKPDCFQYKKCGETFNWKEVLQRHLDFWGVQKDKKYKCHWPGCGKAFTRNEALKSHIKNDHQQRGAGTKLAAEEAPEPPTKKPKLMLPNEEKVLLDGVSVNATFFPQTQQEAKDLKNFLRDTLERMKQRLQYAIKEKLGIKWNLFLQVEMKIEDYSSEEPRRVSPTFRAGPYTSTYPGELEKQLRIAKKKPYNWCFAVSKEVVLVGP